MVGRSWPEVGGDHACSAGGYTAGVGEDGIIGGKNGEGSTDVLAGSYGMGVGGGYYVFETSISGVHGEYESWFGLGGCWYGHDNNRPMREYWSTAGSGGTAGQGGIIKYSSTSEIYSYNGNMITENDFNYNQQYYEYDEGGNYLDGTNGKDAKVAQVVELKNDSSKKIIPAKIFIQDGIRRAVYDNLCYMPEDRKEKYGLTGEIPEDKIKNTSQNGKVQCVEIIEEKIDMVHFSQGIGSGAGYIEVSNGTYEVDPALN